MEQVILVIHLIVSIAMVGIILLQHSEGGGLGIGGGGGGGAGSFLNTRGSASLMTRTTAALATTFMCTSILLAIMAGAHKPGLLETLEETSAPVSQPAPVVPSIPVVPSAPEVPLDE
ncbi:MAG: preprotein translocase subunit SecG [Pseudomonadota bacterium]|nr:preprotein translocase subunit SecG [Pseudomonadota bacterium]